MVGIIGETIKSLTEEINFKNVSFRTGRRMKILLMDKYCADPYSFYDELGLNLCVQRKL